METKAGEMVTNVPSEKKKQNQFGVFDDVIDYDEFQMTTFEWMSV